MSCLLSIIIPTKNRYSTLLPLLDYLVQLPGKDYEIVVQDNSDDNKKMLKYLEGITNARIAYFHTTEDLSQTGNSDLAVQMTNGQYICFIGDDDGVMPYIVNLVAWMKNNNIEAIRGYKPFYIWPGLPVSILDPKMTTGILKFHKFNYKITKYDTKKGLNNLLKKGGTDISLLPCLYHGIVSRKVLDRVFKQTNSYFPGPSPDMANATALAMELKEFIYLDFPVVISGRSVNSIAGKGVLHNHVSKIENVQHLPKNTINNWEKKIPKYWTGETIWAESAIKCIKRYNAIELINEFNFNYLYAKILVFNFGLRKIIFEDFPYKVYNVSTSFYFLSQLFMRVFRLVKNRIFIKDRVLKENLEDIGVAINILNKKIDNTKLPFQNIN